MRVLIVSVVAWTLGACTMSMGDFGSNLSPQTASAPVRAVPQLTPPPTAGSLIGLDVYGLRSTFGSPNFLRSENGAEIWRYAGQGCTLFVYLYEDDASTLRTTFVEARAEAGGELPVDPCVAGVNRAHQLSASGY